jgi:hypothetical protein
VVLLEPCLWKGGSAAVDDKIFTNSIIICSSNMAWQIMELKYLPPFKLASTL